MRALLIERAREAVTAARDGKPMPLPHAGPILTTDPRLRADPNFVIGYLVGTIEGLLCELEAAGAPR